MDAAHEAGNRIRAARENRGWTLRDLADRIDLDFGYLGKVERGAAASLPVYETIARSLGLHVEALFTKCAPHGAVRKTVNRGRDGRAASNGRGRRSAA